ncbi:MAG TPA: hypothetical protein VHL30_05020, partial [Chlamydiales bacterium]|nr:hypothetical protein [Chlamydiales bacterium]
QPFLLKSTTTWAELNALPRMSSIVVEEGPDSKDILACTIKKIYRSRLADLGKIFLEEGEDAIKDDFAFECLWDQALANRSIHWTKDQPLTKQCFQRIGEAIEADCIFKGAGVQAGTEPSSRFHALTEYLVGRNDLPKEMTGSEALEIFYEAIERDPVGACYSFQQELRVIFQKSADAEIPRLAEEPQREALFKMFIGHMISALPFAYPEVGSCFPIPVKIGDEWVVKEYKIDERIELTPGPFSPLLAFGLIAVDDPEGEAPPLMTFSGTTWGEGRFISLLSDFTPFMSVGHVPYLLGHSKIDSWIDRNFKGTCINLYGASLGGALCFHALRNHKDRLGSVNVYNPAGLYPFLWKGPFDDHDVNIYLQQNDIISTSGYFPTGTGVHIYRIVGEQSDGWREAHGRGYGGGKRVTLIQSSSAFENSRWKRTAWTALHFLIGLTLGVALWAFFALACLFHALKEKACQLINYCFNRQWTLELSPSRSLLEID